MMKFLVFSEKAALKRAQSRRYREEDHLSPTLSPRGREGEDRRSINSPIGEGACASKGIISPCRGCGVYGLIG